MSEDSLIGVAPGDAASDTRTDHPAAGDGDGILTSDDEALMLRLLGFLVKDSLFMASSNDIDFAHL